MPVAAPSIPFRMMTHTQEHKCDGCGVVWRVWDSLFLNKARQCGKTASLQVCVCVCVCESCVRMAAVSSPPPPSFFSVWLFQPSFVWGSLLPGADLDRPQPQQHSSPSGKKNQRHSQLAPRSCPRTGFAGASVGQAVGRGPQGGRGGAMPGLR